MKNNDTPLARKKDIIPSSHKNGNKPQKQNPIPVLFIGVLMGALDISIVGPAIPSIQTTIEMDEKALAWIFSAYVLFNLSGISLMTKLSDRFGRRSIYMVSVLIFAFGSLIVSLSHQYGMLIFGRAVQGFGSSGIFPVASAVIGDVFPPEKRGRALGMIGSVFGIAFIIGPVIAGIILNFLPWNYLFLINLPIALFVLWKSRKVLPDKAVNASASIDWKGIVLLSTFLFLFAFALYAVDPDAVWASLTSTLVSLLLLFSGVLLVLLVLAEQRAEDPIVNLSFFRKKQMVIVLGIAMGTGIFEASFVFVPGLATSTFHVDASTASFMLLPSVVAVAIGSPLWGRLIDRSGSRLVIVGGLILAGLGLYTVSLVEDQTHVFYLAGILFGFGLSALLGSSLRYIALNEVSASDRATAQGMMTIFISTGQIFGSVLIGVIASVQGEPEGLKLAFLYLSFITAVLVVISTQLKNRKKELATASG